MGLVTDLRNALGQRAIRARYRRVYGQEVPDVPRTFTDKLFHRMLNWHGGLMPDEVPSLVDKYTVREHVRSTIGERYLIPCLRDGAALDEIDWRDLPRQTVLKPTHMSGKHLLVRDQDHFDLIDESERWLNTNWYHHAREIQYRELQPGLMLERQLIPESGPLYDYKFWCFGGQVKVIHVDEPTRSINPFFDRNWTLLDLHYRPHAERPALPRPGQLDEMIEIAEALAEGYGFVRIDLYCVNGHIYFGEYTFTPTAGSFPLLGDGWEERLGVWW